MGKALQMGGQVDDKVTEYAEQEPNRTFIELGFLGKNAWWRYVLGYVAIIAGGFGLSVLLGFVLTAFEKQALINALVNDPKSITLAPLADQAFAFAFLLISIIIFLVPFFLFIPLLHGRSWRTYIFNGRFNWRGFRSSLGVALIVPTIMITLGVYFEQGEAVMEFKPLPWLVFAVLALLLMPLQVLAEEVLTRGYLMQMIGRATSSYALRLLVPALTFAALHGANTEVGAGGMWAIGIYILLALYLGFLVIWGNGLEYSLGFHLGNNLFVALIASTTDSSFVTPALFIEPAPEWGPESLIQTAIFLGGHYVIMRLWMRFFGSRGD